MSRKLICLIAVILAAGLVQTSLADLLDPSLVAWWKLDEGTGDTAADSSGRNLHGALVNDPEWRTEGVRDGCLFFDGDDAHVLVEHQDVLNPNAGSFTISFWAYVEETAGTSGSTNWDLVVAKRDTGSVGYYVGAERGQGGASETGYRFMLGDTDATRTDTGYVVVPLAEWVFVTAVLDRAQDEQKISADGGQTWATTTPPPGPIAPVTDLSIGWDVGQNDYWFHGTIDDVIFFNRTLSDGEIAEIMERGLVPELAKDALPENRATDIPLDVVLNWTSGAYAATHDVYLGTSLADVESAGRANPLDTLVSQGQVGTTYDPGHLAYGQTYYWRVDEVNAAPDATIYQGDVWQFTVEPYAYAIQTIDVTTNGRSDEGKEPENMVNGSGLDADDRHSTDSADMWAAFPADDGSLWIQYEFDKVYKLYEVLVWNYNVQYESLLGFGIRNATVEYSENGVDWTVLGDADLAQGTGEVDYAANTTIDCAGVAARYVKLTVNNGFGTMGQFGLSEVRFLYVPVQAREPEPADGSTDVGATITLGWRAGREAAVHEVYLGSDPNALPLVATVEASVYDTGDLDLGTTYYWQIVEVNEAETIGAWPGELWSFATQEYIVVDDFESYTDISPYVLFQTWVDGWGFEEDDFFPNGRDGNGSGAQVGYLSAPYAEQAVVHGGSQSMPLVYDNTSVSYSEAERSFDEPQDWTRYGVETLTLYFRGASENTGQPYLKIDGVKVAYDGPAEDIAKVTWQMWSVDLASIGTNLTAVRTLAIGVEGSGATGTLYVDDIGLYRTASEAATEPDSAHLVAYYAFEDDVTDGSGNGLDGTIGGEPVYVAGMKGQALQFDGVDDYVGVANNTLLNPGDGSFSATFWAYLDPSRGSSGSGEWDLAVAKRGSSGSMGYYIGANRDQGDSDQAGYKFMLGNTAGSRVDTPYALVPLDEWVFVASVLDRAQNVHKVSVNGGSTWVTAAPPSGSIALNADLGLAWDIGQNNYWFHGAMDEVRFYNIALTDAEVAWLIDH